MVHGIKDINCFNNLILMVRSKETVHSNGELCLPSYNTIYELDMKRKEVSNAGKSVNLSGLVHVL